ncbi:hypothetical protein P692DRAFT_201811358 [Suillus brevipes Sb2]|nr:hypothetical protein P692DRAFT_201811358 [Suillus brevipes Sb2]
MLEGAGLSIQWVQCETYVSLDIVNKNDKGILCLSSLIVDSDTCNGLENESLRLWYITILLILNTLAGVIYHLLHFITGCSPKLVLCVGLAGAQHTSWHNREERMLSWCSEINPLFEMDSGSAKKNPTANQIERSSLEDCLLGRWRRKTDYSGNPTSTFPVNVMLKRLQVYWYNFRFFFGAFARTEGRPSCPERLALVPAVRSEEINGSKLGTNVPCSASSSKACWDDKSGKAGWGNESGREGDKSGKAGWGSESGSAGQGKLSGREGWSEGTGRKGWFRESSGVTHRFRQIPMTDNVVVRGWLFSDVEDTFSRQASVRSDSEQAIRMELTMSIKQTQERTSLVFGTKSPFNS